MLWLLSLEMGEGDSKIMTSDMKTKSRVTTKRFKGITGTS